jgi:iron complex transport system permease protein
VTQVRAPRVIGALCVGGALAAAGAAYQQIFRNPLVSPDILGVSAGSALGASAALLVALPVAAVQASAFAGGLLASALVIAIGMGLGSRDPLLSLVLAGVALASLFGAGVALLKALADPYNQLPAITFWLMGSFSGASPRDVAIAFVPMALATLLLWSLRWRIDALALPDDEARSLGIDAPRLRIGVMACATLATAASVALAGTIGWVGLLVPHAVRLITGGAFARVLPLSIVLGAGFMVCIDTACRTAFAAEMPPGVLTAFAGTPVFLALMGAALRRAS